MRAAKGCTKPARRACCGAEGWHSQGVAAGSLATGTASAAHSHACRARATAPPPGAPDAPAEVSLHWLRQPGPVPKLGCAAPHLRAAGSRRQGTGGCKNGEGRSRSTASVLTARGSWPDCHHSPLAASAQPMGGRSVPWPVSLQVAGGCKPLLPHLNGILPPPAGGHLRKGQPQWHLAQQHRRRGRRPGLLPLLLPLRLLLLLRGGARAGASGPRLHAVGLAELHGCIDHGWLVEGRGDKDAKVLAWRREQRGCWCVTTGEESGTAAARQGWPCVVAPRVRQGCQPPHPGARCQSASASPCAPGCAATLRRPACMG